MPTDHPQKDPSEDRILSHLKEDLIEPIVYLDFNKLHKGIKKSLVIKQITNYSVTNLNIKLNYFKYNLINILFELPHQTLKIITNDCEVLFQSQTPNKLYLNIIVDERDYDVSMN